jgi:periplasmic protein TonB
MKKTKLSLVFLAMILLISVNSVFAQSKAKPQPKPKKTLQKAPVKAEKPVPVVEVEAPPPPVDRIMVAEEMKDEVMRAPEAPVQEESGNTVYNNAAIEEPAEFPGGITELMKSLTSSIIYPVDARKNGTQGRVVISFVVEKDGSITRPKVLKSISTELDNEAVRVVQTMPKWKPGKSRGQNVRCSFTLPISFKIEEPEPKNEKN